MVAFFLLLLALILRLDLDRPVIDRTGLTDRRALAVLVIDHVDHPTPD